MLGGERDHRQGHDGRRHERGERVEEDSPRAPRHLPEEPEIEPEREQGGADNERSDQTLVGHLSPPSPSRALPRAPPHPVRAGAACPAPARITSALVTFVTA